MSDSMRDALVAAVPWLFEHGHHTSTQCYRGSDDGCHCGLEKAQKIVDAALSEATHPQDEREALLEQAKRYLRQLGLPNETHAFTSTEDITTAEILVDFAGWQARAALASRIRERG